MPRVTIMIQDEERDGLVQMARAELRDPRDQLRAILRQALQQQGLIAAKPLAESRSPDPGEQEGGSVDRSSSPSTERALHEKVAR